MKTWETSVIVVEWDAARGDYRATLGIHNESIYGVENICNVRGSFGWELESFVPQAWETGAAVGQVTSYLAVFKRAAPD